MKSINNDIISTLKEFRKIHTEGGNNEILKNNITKYLDDSPSSTDLLCRILVIFDNFDDDIFLQLKGALSNYDNLISIIKQYNKPSR